MIGPEVCAPLHAAHPGARRWIVAFSGGMDSRVLLELCARFLRDTPGSPRLEALHVDHGVHPESTDWSQRCAEQCAALGVVFHARRAALEPGAISEDRLRRARYRVFEEFGAAGDLLLLAHHQDDQAETVLLRLMRGAGPSGLAGMPAERPCGGARLCRPLLEYPRASLRGFAEACDIGWIEDPANASPAFGRNLLRHRVMPVLEQRWPGVAERIARAAAHCGEAAAIGVDLAARDLRECLRVDRLGEECLALAPWRSLGAPRARNLLREWLRLQGVGPPESRSIETLISEVIEAGADRQPRLVFGARVVRRFDDALYVVARRSERAPPPAGFAIAPGYAHAIEGVGRISLLPERTGGVRRGARFEIAFRRPGLLCRFEGRPGKSLKQVLQEAGVPPWRRDAVPLLFVDGALAAVGEIGVCEGFAAPPGEEGVRLLWTPQPPYRDLRNLSGAGEDGED